MKKTALVSFTIVGLVAAGFTAFYPKSVKSEDLAPKPAKSDQLVEIDQNSPNPAKPAWDKPLISATTDITLNRPQSIVYCPTITVAWQELRKKFDVTKPTPFTEQLDQMDKQFHRSSLPENAYVALSGTVADGIVEQIKSAHQQYIGETIDLGNPEPTNVFTYCALKHDIIFPKPMITLDHTQFTDVSGKAYQSVKGFGSTNNETNKYSSQIDVINYDDTGYTLRLFGEDKTYAVILSAFHDPPNTLVEAIQQTHQRLYHWQQVNMPGLVDKTAYQSPEPNEDDLLQLTVFPEDARRYGRLKPAMLRYHDIIRIPNLALKEQKSFNEIVGTILNPKESEDLYNLTKAQQMVDFNLNNKGAYLKSFALFEVVSIGIEEVPSPPRHFVFNRPFLCTMWKDGESMPYLAVWVNGPDVLGK